MLGNIIANAMLSSNAVAKTVGTSIHKNADKILITAGIGLVVGGTVSAAVSSKNIATIVEKHKKAIAKVNAMEDTKERGHAKLEVYKDTAIQMMINFGPCILLTGTGIACIIGSHQILTRRLASCQAAYAMLDTSFREYRDRVKEVVGEEKENDIFNNTSEIEIGEIDEKGKVKTTKQKKKRGPHGPYSFLFDEANPNWLKDGGRNRDFLLQRQWWAQDKLTRSGELTLADVLWDLDMFESKKDIPTYCFDVVWEKDSPKGGYVSFGLEENVDFMAGREPSVWLTFNPDGFRRKLRKEDKAYLNAQKSA